jgi:acetyltransferase-like isoleucine patch superfamily enzyme
MKIFKLWYHVVAAIQKTLFKLVYGRSLKIGKGSTWRGGFSLMIDQGAQVNIGNACFFNNGCSINANGRITIGDGSLFGENVKIYDHNHRFRNKDVSIKEQGFSVDQVEIGSHTWIGSNTVILKGTKIGDNCTIGAGCVVSGEVPSGTMVRSDNMLIYEDVVFSGDKNGA